MKLVLKETSLFLKQKYGIITDAIYPVKGGWSTKAAYRAVSADGVEYFVKIYDKHLPTTRIITERIDLYMPVLDWLSATQGLRGRILTPVATIDGAYKAETENDVYAIFLYINGETVGINNMTKKQTIELAETLALLHNSTVDVPVDVSGLSEDISLSFCERLISLLNSPDKITDIKIDKLVTLITSNSETLKKAALDALHLRDSLRIGYLPLVLCHGDAHGNNVIQGNRLVLADWDDLRLAPPEADLFIYHWHNYGNLLLDSYCAARQGYEINKELLYLYHLRRRIEDLWVDIERLTEELPSETEISEMLGWISESICHLQKMCK